MHMAEDPSSAVASRLRHSCDPQPTTCKSALGADVICELPGGTFQQMSGLPERPGLPSPLGPQLWPLAFAPGNPPMLPAPPCQQLTTCSWEQNDTIVKVYVPLRGIQTDMLRPVFTSNSAEVGFPTQRMDMLRGLHDRVCFSNGARGMLC